jgi:hypothetical protein
MNDSQDAQAIYRREVARWRAERQLPPRGDVPFLHRCEHCRVLFEPPVCRGSSTGQYCCETHRRAGLARVRMGLARDVMPDATPEELRQLSSLTRDARAGRRPWAEVTAFTRRQDPRTAAPRSAAGSATPREARAG